MFPWNLHLFCSANDFEFVSSFQNFSQHTFTFFSRILYDFVCAAGNEWIAEAFLTFRNWFTHFSWVFLIGVKCSRHEVSTWSCDKLADYNFALFQHLMNTRNSFGWTESRTSPLLTKNIPSLIVCFLISAKRLSRTCSGRFCVLDKRSFSFGLTHSNIKLWSAKLGKLG